MKAGRKRKKHELDCESCAVNLCNEPPEVCVNQCGTDRRKRCDEHDVPMVKYRDRWTCPKCKDKKDHVGEVPDEPSAMTPSRAWLLLICEILVLSGAFFVDVTGAFILAFFLYIALKDALKGEVPGIIFFPMALLLFAFHLTTALTLFLPLVLILLALWVSLFLLQRRVKCMDPSAVYLGAGDVFGLPFAVALAQIFLPVLGLIAFTAGTLVSLPFALRKKNVRLLPWMVPGVFVSVLTGVVAILL